MSVVRLTTATGASEPVTLDDLKAYGRIVSTDEQRVIEQLLLAARQEVERYSGLVLVPGTFLVSLDAWAARLELPLTPVRGVTSVGYRYADAADVTVDPATYYADLDATPARVVFSNPYARPYGLRGAAGIELEVVAGYETRADVPEDVRQHVMTLALLKYEHRDDPDQLQKVRQYAADGASAFSVVTL
jgi:uncharacterized phiE125 gp8 family phage protein